MNIRNRKNNNGECGLQLVELAVVLPMLTLVIAGIAEFGNYFYTYTTLAKAVRSGGRYIASNAYTDTEKTRAKNLVVCGNPGGCASGTEILSGLSAANVEITSTGATYLPTSVSVRIINYQYRSILKLNGWMGGAAWDNVNVGPRISMRYMNAN